MLRQETLQYLSEYETDEEKISLLLLELGEDPDASDFPDDTVERAEQFYAQMGKAKQKVLVGGGEKDTAIALQQVAQMTFQLLEQQGISLPMEVIAVLAQSKIEEMIKLADQIDELGERAFVARSTHNQTRFVNRLVDQSRQSIQVIDAVIGEESQSEWIASSTPATQLNGEVKSFLSDLDARRKARKQIEQGKGEAIASLPPANPKEFVKAFLAARKGN